MIERRAAKNMRFSDKTNQSHKEITLQRLQLYLKAERDITSSGQTVEIEGMRITRADLNTIRTMIALLRKELNDIEIYERRKSKSRIKQVVPSW